MNIVVSTASAAATGGVGASLVAVIRAGDAILLDGDLGAGKTVFTQGLARASGIDEVVTSPTFTLVNRYPTTIGPDLLHADLYRLDDVAQIVELGLPELLDDDAFAVVEWGERAAGTIGDDYLQVTFFRDGYSGEGDDSQRRIELRPVGDRWTARWPAVVAAIDAAPDVVAAIDAAPDVVAAIGAAPDVEAAIGSDGPAVVAAPGLVSGSVAQSRGNQRRENQRSDNQRSDNQVSEDQR